jgi:hypothetical protein
VAHWAVFATVPAAFRSIVCESPPPIPSWCWLGCSSSDRILSSSQRGAVSRAVKWCARPVPATYSIVSQRRLRVSRCTPNPQWPTGPGTPFSTSGYPLWRARFRLTGLFDLPTDTGPCLCLSVASPRIASVSGAITKTALDRLCATPRRHHRASPVERGFRLRRRLFAEPPCFRTAAQLVRLGTGLRRAQLEPASRRQLVSAVQRRPTRQFRGPHAPGLLRHGRQESGSQRSSAPPSWPSTVSALRFGRSLVGSRARWDGPRGDHARAPLVVTLASSRGRDLPLASTV